MAKVALLIGVGRYLPSSGFKNLAAAKPDVEAMRQVLVDPERSEERRGGKEC